MAAPDDHKDLLLAYDELVCRKCGNLLEVCADRDGEWHPHMSVCWPTATSEWGMRVLRKRHEKPPQHDKLDGLHPLDGVHVWASTVEPFPDPFVSAETEAARHLQELMAAERTRRDNTYEGGEPVCPVRP